LGDTAPIQKLGVIDYRPNPQGKVADFPLPAVCWLQDARLPAATRLSVMGTAEKGMRFPGAKDQTETESFIFYDGLMPAPDYLHCDKLDDTSVTLRNSAPFPMTRLFLVDRRVKGQTRFAFLDVAKRPLNAGASLTLKPQLMGASDWPATGNQRVRQALLDAGLFEPEADSLLKIWQKQFFESDGLTAFHILPEHEYDRMLPLDIIPQLPTKPVRVGIALHTNLEIEPALVAKARPLILQLDDPKFQVREAAARALLEIGPIAIGILRGELNRATSLEMRQRIQAVIDRVDGEEWLKSGEAKK
jgi:hypothetical protein